MTANKEQALENLEKAQGKQTGPVTDAGKDSSSRNAIKHGGYSEEKIFGNCKGNDCWMNKTGRCNLFKSGKVKEGELCLQQVEAVKSVKLDLQNNPIKAAKDVMGMHASLQDNTIRTAHAYISEEGLMVDETVGHSKGGIPITVRKPHGALEFVRRGTKDLNSILKDLTGFNVGKDEGPGYLMEDVLRALDQEESMGSVTGQAPGYVQESVNAN